jgi:hypothetical protein
LFSIIPFRLNSGLKIKKSKIKNLPRKMKKRAGAGAPTGGSGKVVQKSAAEFFSEHQQIAGFDNPGISVP